MKDERQDSTTDCGIPFIHVTPKPDLCEHDFQGWRDFPDGNGGEAVCAKCGMGAMAYTLSTGV